MTAMLARDACAWWLGMVTGIIVGLAVAYRHRVVAFAVRLLEGRDTTPTWPAALPPGRPAAPGRSHLRLIWVAEPRKLYDVEAESGDVA